MAESGSVSGVTSSKLWMMTLVGVAVGSIVGVAELEWDPMLLPWHNGRFQVGHNLGVRDISYYRFIHFAQ